MTRGHAALLAILITVLVFVPVASAQRPANARERSQFRKAEAKWFARHGVIGVRYQHEKYAYISTVNHTWGDDIPESRTTVYSALLRLKRGRWKVIAMRRFNPTGPSDRCGVPVAVAKDLFPKAPPCRS